METLIDKVATIERRVLDMSFEEKWKMINESFGMWENYPDDWLNQLRGGGTLEVYETLS